MHNASLLIFGDWFTIESISSRVQVAAKNFDAWKCARMLDTHDKEASQKLEQLVIEKMALGDVKYCTNRKCNNPFEFAGGEHACMSCPLCRVGTCGKCGLAWHEGKTCEQAMGATELAEVVKENNWRHRERVRN